MRSGVAWRQWGWAVLVLLAVALRLALLIVGLRHLPATADECISALLAKGITRGELPLLSSGQPYMFPLEAYLMAPLSGLLPRTAWAARYLTVLLGLTSAVLFLLALRRAFGHRAWPGLVLVLIPSVYWLTVQVGYPPPQYPTMALVTAILFYAVGTLGATPDRCRYGLVGAVGLSAGLGLSNHLLVLPAVLACGVALCLGSSLRVTVGRLLAFALGMAVGLIPYLLALWGIPGAYQEVSHRLPLAQALAKLWNPMLAVTLPGAAGINPPFFPDFAERLQVLPARATAGAGLALVLLFGVAAVRRAVILFRRLFRERRLVVELADAAVAAGLLAMLMFVFSQRSLSHAYRYLLIPVWALPVIVADVVPHRRLLRFALTGTVAVLAIFNLAVSVVLIRAWSQPDFAARAAETPPLTELLAHLRARGVRHCYATMWLSYRITYETDEAILCSPPYNERFHRWPLPYKAEVDAAPEAVFVLSPAGHRLTSTQFERDLRTLGVECDRVTVGPFQVYSNFHHPLADRELVLASRSLTGSASHSPETAWQLCDGRLHTVWCSGSLQTTGMWVQARWSSPQPLQRVSLHYDHAFPDHAGAMRVLARSGAEWLTVTNLWPGGADRVRYARHRPIHGEFQQTLRFPAVTADAVRVEIVTPHSNRCWSVAELEVGVGRN